MSKLDKNKKVLIIDFMNMFLRHYVVNCSCDVNGEPTGGVIGFFNDINRLIAMFSPCKVVVCFDGKYGRKRRLKMFDGYKAGRKSAGLNRQYFEDSEIDRKENKHKQIEILKNLFLNMPFHCIDVETCEADDSIAYICEQKLLGMQKIVVSVDKDFLQLLSDEVSVYNPIRKKMLTVDNINEDYTVSIKNFIIYKALLGDKGDNVPHVKGIGDKTIFKLFPFLSSEDRKYYLDDVFKYCSDNCENGEKLDSKYKLILENRDLIETSYDLTQLKASILNGEECGQIDDSLSNKAIFNVLPLKIAMDSFRLLPMMDVEKFFESLRLIYYKSNNCG